MCIGDYCKITLILPLDINGFQQIHFAVNQPIDFQCVHIKVECSSIVICYLELNSNGNDVSLWNCSTTEPSIRALRVIDGLVTPHPPPIWFLPSS